MGTEEKKLIEQKLQEEQMEQEPLQDTVEMAEVPEKTELPEEVEEMKEASEEEKTKVYTAEDLRAQALEEQRNALNQSTLDFDWENVTQKTEDYDPETKKKLSEEYLKTLSTIEQKELIEGTIVHIGEKEVVVNIGYKSEGVIPRNEFPKDKELKVGDKVLVYVEKLEDETGQLVLSYKKAALMDAWNRINEVHKTGEIVIGKIKARTKGGMIVDLWGIECFLPGSQIDIQPVKDFSALVGQKMDFKVVKINPEFRNVVVSHKAILEEEVEKQKEDILKKLEVGQVVEGVVKNITSYGVFMDLGGIDGLIHITDLSWGRINHPEEIVELGQKLKVVILSVDFEKKRVSLGLKQLQPQPWDQLDPNLKPGDIIEGKVVVVTDYGAFVEIIPGVEGLVHVSEMSWSSHLRSAQEFVKVGDIVKAKILTLDRENRKISLSMKQLKPDPWQDIEKKYPVGSKHRAKVLSFTNFGLYVELEEGIDGFIHIHDLSWTKKINHPSEFIKIGEEIDVVVLEIDKENRKLTLGHKQLEENPWDTYEKIFYKDSIHDGTVVKINDKGAIILLPYGVEAFASKNHLIKENGEPVKQDEKLKFKVIEFSKAAKRIVVSHTKVWQDQEKAAVKSYAKKGKKPSGASLGDITNLEELKKLLLEEENEKNENKDKK